MFPVQDKVIGSFIDSEVWTSVELYLSTGQFPPKANLFLNYTPKQREILSTIASVQRHNKSHGGNLAWLYSSACCLCEHPELVSTFWNLVVEDEYGKWIYTDLQPCIILPNFPVDWGFGASQKDFSSLVSESWSANKPLQIVTYSKMFYYWWDFWDLTRKELWSIWLLIGDFGHSNEYKKSVKYPERIPPENHK